MNTATLPAVPNIFANLQAERVRMGQWAFAAAVRLSDQNRPIGLKLIIECMFLFQALMRYVRASPAATAQRASRGAPAVRPVRSAAPAARNAVATRRQARSSVPQSGRRSVTRACMGRQNRACVQQKSRFLCKVGLDR